MLRISLIPLREGEYLIDKGKLLNEEIESTVRITKDDAKIVSSTEIFISDALIVFVFMREVALLILKGRWKVFYII